MFMLQIDFINKTKVSFYWDEFVNETIICNIEMIWTV